MAATTTSLLCRLQALCVHRAALRTTASNFGRLQRVQRRHGIACRHQYSGGSTPDPPDPPKDSSSVDSSILDSSTADMDTFDFDKFDPDVDLNEAQSFNSDASDFDLNLDDIDIAEAEKGYDSVMAASEDQKAARSMQRERKERSMNELSQLETLPIMHVRCTFNNTYIDICDKNGRILGWKSAGGEGYKKSRRGTSFAAQAAGLAAASKAREFGFERVRVKLKGPGIGRQYSLKGFELGGLKVASIQDVTPVPHNGCRPKKKRTI